jgi:outer membrane protein assembly factor BamB
VTNTESSPLVVEGVVYFKDWLSNIYAVTAVTGIEKWELSMNGGTTSAIFQDGMVYIGATASSSFYALDGQTGKVIWNQGISGYPMSSPTINNHTLYVGTTSGADFMALDSQTGTKKMVANDRGVAGGGAVSGCEYCPSGGRGSRLLRRCRWVTLCRARRTIMIKKGNHTVTLEEQTMDESLALIKDDPLFNPTYRPTTV